MGEFLRKHPDRKLQVLVVWEPITILEFLKFSQPTSSTMARIPDSRVRQYWDPKHLIAKDLARRAEMGKSNPSYPQPECCFEGGFNFDQALVYAPGARWHDAPTPRFWNGAVFEVIEGIEKALREVSW